ncbi:peptidogalycan biosysnthesis protein, partial [Candidatus Binatus sp.]
MNDSAPRLDVAIVEGIDKVSRDAWDGLLAPDDSPFVEWDWLRAMEQSGSAARDTGWAPYHLIVRQGPAKKIVAACPLYLKTHSMGEFVFDHGWADAAERAGLRYFPKIVVGVPF